MGSITLQQAAQWVGGRIDPKYKDVTFCGAEYDSRNLQPGQLFVAIKAARDGHDFIPAALDKGASAVLCTHCDGDYHAIVVCGDDWNKGVVGLAAGKLSEQWGYPAVALARDGNNPIHHNGNIVFFVFIQNGGFI